MHVKSFGCSFVWGSEHLDTDLEGAYSKFSHTVWPAILASRLGADYNCYAQPGSGNFQIAAAVLDQAASAGSDEIFINGWTWIDRFDFMIADEKWRPHWETICPIDDHALATTFYRHIHSEPWNKLRNLMMMNTVLNYLTARGIRFIMTLMDELVLDQRWHVTPGISVLQTAIRPHISRFEDMDFLTWSKQKGHAITSIGHPLEEAHAAAADLMQPVIESILHRV